MRELESERTHLADPPNKDGAEGGGASGVDTDPPPTDELDQCTLSDLSEGYLGKIQIRKSGKTRLVMGGASGAGGGGALPSTHMNIDLGTQVRAICMRFCCRPPCKAFVVFIGHIRETQISARPLTGNKRMY